jgi:hypothetical protein
MYKKLIQNTVILLSIYFVLQAADGFLFVVQCDSGRIIYVSDSIVPVLHQSQVSKLNVPRIIVCYIIIKFLLIKLHRQCIVCNVFDLFTGSLGSKPDQGHAIVSLGEKNFSHIAQHWPVPGTDSGVCL